MKRTLITILTSFLLCVCMVFGLAGCGTSQEDIDNAVNEATAPLSERITALEAEKAALTAEKNELLADIEEIEAQVSALETDKATLEASVTAKNDEIATLTSSITDLNTEKTTLTARVSELESENAELQSRINCLEGKHVLNETLPTSYAYVWSKTAPISTKHYTCLHCENEVYDNVSPSAWQVGDTVTYVAKDGNAYVSTVAEVTGEKAVLFNNTVHSVEYTYDKWTDEKVLALLDDVGARYPSKNEAVETLYQTTTGPYVNYNNAGSVAYRFLAVYQEGSTVMYRYSTTINYYKDRSYWGSYNNRTATLYYCYVWDVPITTAE